MNEPVCIRCLRTRAEHHDFEGVPMPPWCRFDPLTWAQNSPGPICEGFRWRVGQSCRGCEHDRECHDV